jgi:hypothetical protein
MKGNFLCNLSVGCPVHAMQRPCNIIYRELQDSNIKIAGRHIAVLHEAHYITFLLFVQQIATNLSAQKYVNLHFYKSSKRASLE